jgi:hypothetical protein
MHVMPKGKSGEVKAWIISVDMGYGHQRAAYPLKDIAYERILTANNDKIISERERREWENARRFYEFISRLKRVPLIGGAFFGLYDRLQRIGPFFPFRDLSAPNYTTLRVKRTIKNGLCKSIVEYTKKAPIHIVTTHFMPALAYHYAGKPCYCVVTDTDINRVWVPDNPKECNITYFSPCKHTSVRLREYGVPEQNIVETGFPLPKENIGADRSILKQDVFARLINLDPKGAFFDKYDSMVREKLGLQKKFGKRRTTPTMLRRYKTHPLTIMYLVGGSGAQTEIGIRIVESLKARIERGDVRIILSAGTRLDAKQQFEEEIARLGLQEHLGKNILITFALDKKSYFGTLNEALRTTDILWTKPSELSFYTALGLPVIIAPPIGAHENYNRGWLEQIGSGFVQDDPGIAHDWLFYWVDDGRLADAALQGFINAPCMGAYNIEEYLRNHAMPK